MVAKVVKYCSLGDECKPGIILRNLGLKTESYPFDWLNCKSDVIKECLKDDFKIFLDRSLYSEQKNTYDLERTCKHNVYHSFIENNPDPEKRIFFRHRDPFSVDEDYEYYVRCVERFRELMASSDNKIFLKTFVNKEINDCLFENSKDLTDFLQSYTTNYVVIAIKHSTTGYQSFNVKTSDNLVYLDVTTINKTNGGIFENGSDQDYFNSIVRDLINKQNEIR